LFHFTFSIVHCKLSKMLFSSIRLFPVYTVRNAILFHSTFFPCALSEMLFYFTLLFPLYTVHNVQSSFACCIIECFLWLTQYFLLYSTSILILRSIDEFGTDLSSMQYSAGILRCHMHLGLTPRLTSRCKLYQHSIAMATNSALCCIQYNQCRIHK
jgi:hypothetical protein